MTRRPFRRCDVFAVMRLWVPGFALAATGLGPQPPTPRRLAPRLPAGVVIQPPADARQPGPAPQDLTAATISPTAVQLMWAAVPGATGYRVLRRGTLVATVPPTTIGKWRPRPGAPGPFVAYTDDGLFPDTKYSYNVAAVFADSLHVEGAWSTTAVTATATITPPTNLTAAKAGLDAITLNWSPVRGASGYLLLRNRQLMSRQLIRSTSFTDRPLPPGAYQYEVIAYHLTLSGRGDTTEVEGELGGRPHAGVILSRCNVP